MTSQLTSADITHTARTAPRTAHELAARMPDLLVEAGRVAQTVTFGIHGRRRKGPGETFWQFRHYEPADAATSIDWRRSASSDGLYVREREWEAAHTVWLWPDLSASMFFRSSLADTAKIDRTIVITLAMAELLIRAGERVGLLGFGRASAHQATPQRLAETLIRTLAAETLSEPAAKPDDRTTDTASPVTDRSLPPSLPVSRFSEYILISDFLAPVEQITGQLTALATQGARGHLVQVTDPAEETLPWSGRVLFQGMEGQPDLLTSQAADLRAAYQARFQAHRDQLQDHCRALQWHFLVHHTDHPAEQAVLALYHRLAAHTDVQTGIMAR